MMKTGNQTSAPILLKLSGYRVTALKPRLGAAAIQLERALREGIAVYPDLTRPGFYDVALDGGWAYIHVHRDSQTAYLIGHSPSTLNAFLLTGTRKQRICGYAFADGVFSIG